MQPAAPWDPRKSLFSSALNAVVQRASAQAPVLTTGAVSGAAVGPTGQRSGVHACQAGGAHNFTQVRHPKSPCAMRTVCDGLVCRDVCVSGGFHGQVPPGEGHAVSLSPRASARARNYRLQILKLCGNCVYHLY